MAGLVIFFGNTFAQFSFSLLSAFNVFYIVGLGFLRRPVFYCLTGVMILGFVLMFVGSLLQRRFKKPELDAAKLGDSTKFYEHQKEYGEPESKGGKATFRFFGITLVLFAATVVFYILWDVAASTEISDMMGTIYGGLYQYSIALGAISIAFLVALIVGNVGEDLFRFYIAGYHVHESVIGAYFVLIGTPLLAAGLYSLEFCIGMAYLVAGIFLVGRDWKDVVKGDILVHYSREPDYDEYKKLKAKRKELK